MKDKIQNLIKNVIEENAIKVKEATNQALYGKVGNRLKQEYINVSKNVFKSLNESASDSGTFMASGEQTPNDVSAATAPPSKGTGGGGTSTPNPDLERPATTLEEWMRERPNINDFDFDGDGQLSNAERAEYERQLRKWYDVFVDLYERWYHFERRFSDRPYKSPKPPNWRNILGSQAFDPALARQRREKRRAKTPFESYYLSS